MSDPPATRTFQELWKARADDHSAQSASPETIAGAGPVEPPTDPLPENSEEATAAKPRSLWNVMRSPASAESGQTATDELRAAQSNPKPKGLWAVMPTEGSAPAIEGARQSDSVHASDSGAPIARVASVAVSPVMPVSRPTRESLFLPDATLAESVWSRRAVAACLCGIATLLLALLSLWPGWLFRVPALLAGLTSAWIGLVADREVRRSRGRQRGRLQAWSGIAFGAAGIVLAPTVLARWGEEWQAEASREVIAARLRNIGAALQRHHDQHGHYPAATALAAGPNGAPLHGWMTPLLPHLGHAELLAKIDQLQPFDAPANRAVMQTVVAEFVIPGPRPIHNARGLALSHFAGVGGSDVREATGVVHLGAFDERGTVRRESITDELSQTLIVGEIASDFPAWGQPGNIRSIGKGLNRQAHGFGNDAGTGAMFLHADGSARFYSKETDRRVLQQLETRDEGFIKVFDE